MATTEKLARAAKNLTSSARQKATMAEEELAIANDELTHAIEHQQPGKVKRAHERTQVAEKAVGEAAQQMEVVEVLLDAVEGSATAPTDRPTENPEGDK